MRNSALSQLGASEWLINPPRGVLKIVLPIFKWVIPKLVPCLISSSANAFKLGMAVGGHACCEWMKSQGDVARAIAEKKGWDYFELSNEGDSATSVKNAQLFVQEGVDAVIQFNGEPGTNAAIQQILGAAGIPVVTYDIAEEGMYFVGIDNLGAGIAGGEGLGKLVKEKWNCEPDLVVSAEGAGAGIVNTWRTGGMRTGLGNICPDIPAEKYKSFDIIIPSK